MCIVSLKYSVCTVACSPEKSLSLNYPSKNCTHRHHNGIYETRCTAHLTSYLLFIRPPSLSFAQLVLIQIPRPFGYCAEGAGYLVPQSLRVSDQVTLSYFPYRLWAAWQITRNRKKNQSENPADWNHVHS